MVEVMKLLPMKDTMNTPMTIWGRGRGQGGWRGAGGCQGEHRVGGGQGEGGEMRRGGQETYTHGLRLRP